VIRALLVFAVVPAYMALASLVGYPLARLAGSPALLYRLGRIRVGLWLSGARVTVRGLDKLADGRNTVVMSNHASLLDAPVLFQALGLDLCAVAKTEVFRFPFLHRCLRYAGFIEVDRDDREQATRAIQAAVASLGQGRSFLIFPEGTRTRDGSLGPFKKGGFRVALDARSRIVPVALSGVRELMPRGAFRIRPGEVRVEVLDPVDAGGYSYDARDQLISEVRDRIAQALRRSATG
jgi:1-acyl-sn-glycerol-3-phosphate acyltransferase